MNPAEATNPGATLVPVQPPLAHRIFVGRDGLRSGWGLLIFIIIFAGLVFTVHAVVHKFHHPPPHAANSEDSPKSAIINEGAIFLVVLFTTWIMSKIERRPNSVYGLGGSNKTPRFFAGLAWGVVCLSLLVLTLWKTSLLAFDRRLLFGGEILRYGAIWLLAFLLVGLLEEYLTRGYLLYTLARALAGIYQWLFKTPHSGALGFWTSSVIFSILFGLGHGKNPGESPIGLLAAGLAGLVFCLSLWRTGSLWWAIGFHTSWDWAQSFLYGVADSGHMAQHRLLATHPVGKPILSGGATGPEGSIYVLAMFVLIVAIIFLTLPRTRPVAALDAELPIRSA